MPGRIYTDKTTVGPQDVNPDFVIVRPSITADDPANGLYQTFAAAHAAAVLLPVPNVTMYIDSPGVIVPVPAGAYDMGKIALVGFPSSSSGVTGLQRLQTAVGATFTNFYNGTEGIWLDHLGVAALYTASPALPNLLRIRTGKNALWTSSGNAAPIVLMSGTGGLQVNVEDGAQMVGDTPGTYEIFQLSGAPGEIELRLFGGSLLSDETLRGPGGSTINVLYFGVGPVFETQSNFAGTLNSLRGADNLFYDGIANASYTGPGPTNTGAALDRIAAAVAGLLGGTIP